MKIGILKADNVRPELVDNFGEYPEMFREILLAADPNTEIISYEIMSGEYPGDIDEVDPIGHVQLTLGALHFHVRTLNGNIDTLGYGNGLFTYT